MNILALDLGTKTGWAVGALKTGAIFDCGTTVLATDTEIRLSGQTRMDRRLDLRAKRFDDLLEKIYAQHAINWVVWEDVQFMSSLQQTQLWATWRAVVWLWAERRHIKTECCPVGTLKKSGTGSGNANKMAMIRALCLEDPQFKIVNQKFLFLPTGNSIDDNTADAVHLLKWSQRTLKRTIQ